MNEYLSVFVLVFVAVLVALFITGTISQKKPHIGLPDQ